MTAAKIQLLTNVEKDLVVEKEHRLEAENKIELLKQEQEDMQVIKREAEKNRQEAQAAIEQVKMCYFNCMAYIIKSN